jgi:hypothetical protein
MVEVGVVKRLLTVVVLASMIGSTSLAAFAQGTGSTPPPNPYPNRTHQVHRVHHHRHARVHHHRHHTA